MSKDDKKTGDGRLIEEEVRATGRVKTSVYMTYLTAAGLFTWVSSILRGCGRSLTSFCRSSSWV